MMTWLIIILQKTLLIFMCKGKKRVVPRGRGRGVEWFNITWFSARARHFRMTSFSNASRSLIDRYSKYWARRVYLFFHLLQMSDVPDGIKGTFTAAQGFIGIFTSPPSLSKVGRCECICLHWHTCVVKISILYKHHAKAFGNNMLTSFTKNYARSQNCSVFL